METELQNSQEISRPPVSRNRIREFLETPKGAIGLVVATSVLALSGCAIGGTENAKPQAGPEAALDFQHFSDFTFDSDPEIIQLDPPLPNPEGTREIEPKGVTLHWWAFSANSDIEALRTKLQENTACGDIGCSVQYAVTEDANIYRMTGSATEYAYHAGTANPTTFGIEIEGAPEDFDLEADDFNKKKFEAVVSLTAELVSDFDLPIEGEATCGDVSGIHGHYEFNDCTNPPGHKLDPGEDYTQAVIRAVQSMQ